MKKMWGLALCTLMLAPLLVVASQSISGAAPTQLFPDLHTLAPRELKLDRADITPDLTGVFHNVLRFSNDTYNSGSGPLIVNAHIDPTTRSGPSTQRVMNSDGTFTDYPLNNDIYWHQAHHHYHFDHWGQYELWTKSAYDAWIASGRTTGAPSYTGVKTTSCITDEEFIVSAPNAVYPGPYGGSGCDVDAQQNIHMGLSVGWGDTYDWYRQDQWIDLNQDTLANGTYVLRSVADPLNFVYESANKSDPTVESVADNEASLTFSIAGGSLVDGVAPTGTVAINHVDKTTASTNVSVSVVGRDDVSGVNQMRLSNNGSTFTTFNYTSSGSVPTTVSWNLADAATGGNSTNGIHTVYAQVHDNSGKWGPTFTDTIDLETGGGPPPPPPPPPSSYSQAVSGDSPAGYWRLDETSGTNAADSKGSNPGTYKNNPTLNASSLLNGDADRAVTFNGSNQSVGVASSTPLSPATAVSVEAWIKPNAIPATGAYASIASKPESYSLQFNGPKLEFTIMQAGTRRRLQAATGAIVAGTTYHIVGTYDGTTQKLYINGVPISAALTGAITTNTNGFNIASWNGSSEFFNGTIDEVAVYPVALSSTQVAAHYNDGINAPPPPNATLTVSRAGTGSGNVVSNPAGLNCGSTCAATFTGGTSLTLTATPTAGSTFTGWSGGSCTGTATCTFTLNANTTVTATFTLSTPTLTVTNAGAGTGTVTSAPTGITCPGTCSSTFATGTQVTLTATPNAGSIFSGWSGGGCSGTGTCVVTLNASTAVSATFVPVNVTILTPKTGGGTGTITSNPAGINCGATCGASFPNGSNVVLTATPDPGTVFTGWSGGGCSGTGSCSFNPTADTVVTATFAPATLTLTVTRAGTGAGTVTSNPAGINCGATCAASFPNGQSVSLTAAPSGGSSFTGWSGGGCSGTGTCVVALTAPVTVTATFGPAGSPYPAAITADGPVGYWRLNETSGTSAGDSVGTNTGTYVGSPTLGAPGLLGSASNKAVTFNGTAKSVSIPSTAALSPATVVSVEAWIKPAALPAAGAFASVTTKAESYALQFNGPKLEFTIMQGGARRRLQAATGAIVAGNVYHVVGTYDGTTQRLYINGVAISAALTGAITTNTTGVRIGSWDGSSEFFNGTIDEVAVYSKTLSAAQVTAHYNAGIAITAAATSTAGTSSREAIDIGGKSPAATAIDPGLQRAFVTRNVGSGSLATNGVAIVDLATGTVVGQVTTGSWGPSSIAVNPVTHLVYVTSLSASPADDTTIVVLDGRTGKIVDRIAAGTGAKAVAVNPKTNRVYVTSQAGVDADEAIFVIDGTTNDVVDRVLIGHYDRYFDNPLGLAVDTATNTIYATNPQEGTVSIIDGTTNTLTKALAIGGQPTALAVDEVRNVVYVTDTRNGRPTVTVVDGKKGAVISDIALGATPRGVAVDQGGDAVYVTTRDGTFATIDPHSRVVDHRTVAGENPYGITVDPATGTVVIANTYGGNIAVYARKPEQHDGT